MYQWWKWYLRKIFVNKIHDKDLIKFFKYVQSFEKVNHYNKAKNMLLLAHRLVLPNHYLAQLNIRNLSFILDEELEPVTVHNQKFKDTASNECYFS